jgi:hypothetical protein
MKSDRSISLLLLFFVLGALTTAVTHAAPGDAAGSSVSPLPASAVAALAQPILPAWDPAILRSLETPTAAAVDLWSVVRPSLCPPRCPTPRCPVGTHCGGCVREGPCVICDCI